MDQKCINTIRCLAADTVQKANSGHPGAPMGCAPMAHTLFTYFIRTNPQNPHWFAKDRFVLSNGHACVLQYCILHLFGFNLSIDDLKGFRQLDSKTPGHPEANHGVDLIEVSTGPLGQGISNAVGLALAEAHLAATFNRDGYAVIDNYTYAICGDGCLQEGVQAEAAAIAGHLKLGKLIVLYDDNKITIDGETELSFTEDVLKRFEAYGWHTSSIGDGDSSDVSNIKSAIDAAKAARQYISYEIARTTIGFGSKNQGLEKVHGSALGAEDIMQVKKKFGFNPEEFFHVPKEVYDFYKQVAAKNIKIEDDWNAMFAKYNAAHPDLALELTRRINKQYPDNWQAHFPRYTPADPAMATRKFSETVLNKIADFMPEMIGGSADLTPSNLTRWKTAKEFQHPSTNLGTYDGRYIRFGVREHGMAAICNGIAAYGALIPFGATFFNFISYALGAVRLTALSRQQVLFIMTHDSIGLGEDGPTHQPIETLAGLRALPNLYNFRPADGNEVSGAYIQAFLLQHSPSVLILSRQNLPNLQGSTVEKVAFGGYVLQEVESPKIILVGTGSEVSLCVEASKLLSQAGIQARVVSMPCTELFDEQSLEYRKSVFLEGVPVLSVEVLSSLGWARYAHASVAMKRFGASAPASKLYTKFGFDPDQISAAGKKLLNFYKLNGRKPEWKVEDPLA